MTDQNQITDQDTQLQPQGFSDYWGFLKRRKWFILIPWILIAGIIGAVAYLLPPVYQSTATILIESQQVPQDLVRTTVTGYAEERIKAITQQILSRQVLLKIINDFDLYRDMRGKVPMEKILDEMRDDITIEMVSAEVPSRRGGRPVTVNVAFTVSFEGKDPQKVMQVTNRLASLFLEHNLQMRERLAETTTKILERQLEDYKKTVEDLEAKIAKFKEKHLTELPELMKINLETERQLRKQIDSISDQIRNLEDRKVYLEGQLASVSPDLPYLKGTTGDNYIIDPRERLKVLKSQELSLEASLSPKHPDVIRIKKEISRLEKEISAADQLNILRDQLKEKKAQLEDLLTRAKEKHPDVVRLKSQISELEKAIKEQEKKSKQGLGLEPSKPTNPAYINLETQIKATEIDIENLKKKRSELEKKWRDYVERLEKTPAVEKDYQQLLRDYQAAQAKYSETMAKLMEARQGETLEESQAGERFTIIDPPQLPEEPIKPKRLAILIIGVVLGLGGGIGIAAIVEASDTTLRVASDVKKATGLPVLAAVPDLRQARKKGGQ